METPLVDSLLQRHPVARVGDKAKVEKLLKSIVEDGHESLQLIVDFDNTLTRAHKDGVVIDNSWGVMENSSLLSKEYTDQTHALRAKYLPIEHDHNLTGEEKTPYMVEWYTKANELLQTTNIKKSFFKQMVLKSNVELREGTEEMLASLNKNRVPCLVLSAGLGDVLVEVMDRFGVYHRDTMNVISNFLKYDGDGKVVGLDGDIIHVFNKNENAVHDSDYFKLLKGRSNVILLGDSLGDLCMAEGVDNPGAILKIGFLNARAGQEETRLPSYLDGYDIVLLDDQTMGLPVDILRQVSGLEMNGNH